MYKFLLPGAVIIINQKVIRDFGGMHGVRDKNLLESSVYAAQATFDGQYLYSTIYEMAAAYAYHIIKDHPFVDGNKRTGLMAAILFLECNGVQIDFRPGELYKLGIKIATSTVTVNEIAKALKRHCF
jgi:death-on-curing protein